MSAQDYKLTKFEPSDFKDDFGNVWCNAEFEGVAGQVRWVVKDPSAQIVGKTYYGEIRDATSKAGKTYKRFHKEQPQDSPQGGSGSQWQPRDDNAIRAQWSIGRAVDTIDWKDPELDLAHILPLIERRANAFYDLVDRVKSHGDKETA